MSIIRSILITVLSASAVLGLGSSAFPEPAAKGEQLFNANCSTCHSTEEGRNRVGPTLHRIVGRHSATVPNYDYSSALASANIVWTEENLLKYLSGPQSMIRCHQRMVRFVRQCDGIKMGFPGFKNSTEAEAVISYLQLKAMTAQSE